MNRTWVSIIKSNCIICQGIVEIPLESGVTNNVAQETISLDNIQSIDSFECLPDDLLKLLAKSQEKRKEC